MDKGGLDYLWRPMMLTKCEYRWLWWWWWLMMMMMMMMMMMIDKGGLDYLWWLILTKCEYRTNSFRKTRSMYSGLYTLCVCVIFMLVSYDSYFIFLFIYFIYLFFFCFGIIGDIITVAFRFFMICTALALHFVPVIMCYLFKFFFRFLLFLP
jgi:hypothetical protein